MTCCIEFLPSSVSAGPRRLSGMVRRLLGIACVWIASFSAFAAFNARPPFSPVQLAPDSRIWNYHFVEAFPGVSLHRPVFAVVPPGETNRILVGQHDGRIYEISPLDAPVARLFLDLSDRVHEESEGGLHGLAFHPQFEKNTIAVNRPFLQ